MAWLDRTRLRALISRWFEVPMVRILVALHFTPNRVTILGLLITFGAGILIAFEYPLAGGITVLAAGIFDLLDGALARETGRSTRFGAFLDSLTDRIGETCVLGGILVLALSREDLGMAFLAYAACACCFLVSYARARAEGLEAPGAVGLMTRPERVVLLSMGLITGFISPVLALVTALSLITVFQRMRHMWNA